MARAPQSDSRTNDRIVLDLLNSVEVDGARSQRHMAAELGIALGLVNAYLRRCIKKGLVKVGDAPARRYAYYLTRQGFAEKSRLTINYLSASFEFFRRAKADCAHVLDAARGRGFHQLVLAGKSDLAEVALLCAAESDVRIVAIVDPLADQRRFAGVAVVPAFADVETDFDAVIVTQVDRAREMCEAAVDAYGAERVFVPAMLGIRTQSVVRAGS